jgi:predicted nucleotidyltransferase
MERKNSMRALKTRRSSRRLARLANTHKQASFELVKRAQIREVVREIAEKFHPEKVILFGSYAYGKPTIDSDVDLLVVMESEERPARRAIRVAHELLDIPFPMDILVRTPAEVVKRLQMEDYFMREVVQQGRVLYERG